MIDWITSKVHPMGVKTHFQHLASWDVPKAETEVHRFLKLASLYGPIDHIEAILAEHWFPGGGAFGIAIEPAETYFNCTIVLNAGSRDYFARWPSARRFPRLMWLLEAYFESLDARWDFEAGDPPGRRYAFSPSPPATIGSMVVAARSSYTVDKRIDRVLAEHFRDIGGQLLRLSVVYAEALTRPTLDQALEQLDFEALVQKEAEPVLIGREPDHLGVWVRCAGHVWSMLSSLARLAAAYDDTSVWTSHMGRLSANRTFSRLFIDAWPLLHGDWRASAVGGKRLSRRASEDCVATLRLTFEKLGIRIIDGKSMTPVQFHRVTDILEQ